MVFTVLAALPGMEREYIRDRTLEGHESARARGKSIGGAAVTDEAMLAVALHLRGQELSLRDIAARAALNDCKALKMNPAAGIELRVPSEAARVDPRACHPLARERRQVRRDLRHRPPGCGRSAQSSSTMTRRR